MTRKPYARPTIKSYGDIRKLTQLLGLKDASGSDGFLGRLDWGSGDGGGGGGAGSGG